MSAAPQQADPDLVAMVDTVLGEHRPATDRQPGMLDRQLWSLLDSLGLTRLTSSEDRGGSGGTWHDAAALLESAAAHRLQLPLAEHDLLAGWALEAAGLPPLGGLTTLGLVGRDGRARQVPWASAADHVVLIVVDGAPPRLEVFAAAELRIEPGHNLAGEARDTVHATGRSAVTATISQDTVDALHHRAALVRAVQASGAMGAAIGLTVTHVRDRVQFGRPLAKFQAVQHRLAEAAAEAALARSATWAAVDEAVETDFRGSGLPVSVAVARSCVGHAGSAVVRAVHQLHGAIGTTREHPLHQLTVPILAWTNENGTVGEFDALLTRTVVTAGTEVWDLVARA